MPISVLVVSLLGWAASADNATLGLVAPCPVVAHDRPIDIQREGQACPYFADFDGDGLSDLLVGEAFGGRLRIYRNLGTKQEPKFGDYKWFRAGDTVASVPWARGGYKGFSPQLVDLDGDGKTDVVSGSYTGELFWFRRIEGVKFAPRANLMWTDGKPIRVTNGAQPSCADWDGDGDIDVVVGTLAGDVLLLENKGLASGPRFAAPVPVLVAGQPIKSALHWKSPCWVHPCVADWNGDGRLDLLVAAMDGSVFLSTNHGTRSMPRFDDCKTLVEKSPVINQEDRERPKGHPGTQPAVCVADFNGDGLPDLILGDGCGRFRGKPHQFPDEAKVAEQNQAHLDQLGEKWAGVFREYRQLSPGVDAKSANADAKLVSSRAGLQAEMEKINTEIAAAQLDVQYDWPRYQTHGFVWIFLRKGAISE